jgi:ribonuclease-3
MVLTQALFEAYPQDREGVLTTKRSRLLNGPFLATLAREIGIDRLLRLSASEEANGGRSREAALEDAFEAVIGAVFQDGGPDAARRAVLLVFGDLEGRLSASQSDANPKGRLQELIQPVHGNDALRYSLLRTEGADHSRTFEAAVLFKDRVIGIGKGASKKAAEEEAARAALNTLKGGLPAAQ